MSDVRFDARLDGDGLALVDLHRGRVHPLRAGPNPIGRGRGNRIVLDDHTVSRRHAVLMVHADGACEVGDTDSRNGVRVHGRRIRGAAPLGPGDVLELCDTRLLLVRAAPGAGPQQCVSTDDTLGPVVWSAADDCWHLTLRLACGRSVPATYTPPDPTPPAPDPAWEVVRACCRWVCSGEPAVRAFVARKLGRRELAVELNLAHVLLTSEGATLIYSGPCAAVCVTADAGGRFVSGPVCIEPGPAGEGPGGRGVP